MTIDNKFKIIKVEESNLDTLYDLNYQLAVNENQKDLFIAARDAYAQMFLGSTPIAFGFLLFTNEQPVGFYIYYFKFASYLGSKVLYIEDVYLSDNVDVAENKVRLLKHAIQQARLEQCCRVEMRVLKSFNIGYDVIKNCGFEHVDKWDVYRNVGLA